MVVTIKHGIAAAVFVVACFALACAALSWSEQFGPDISEVE